MRVRWPAQHITPMSHSEGGAHRAGYMHAGVQEGWRLAQGIQVWCQGWSFDGNIAKETGDAPGVSLLPLKDQKAVGQSRLADLGQKYQKFLQGRSLEGDLRLTVWKSVGKSTAQKPEQGPPWSGQRPWCTAPRMVLGGTWAWFLFCFELKNFLQKTMTGAPDSCF